VTVQRSHHTYPGEHCWSALRRARDGGGLRYARNIWIGLLGVLTFGFFKLSGL